MARPRDNPADQAAKGFPGKRKSKVERMIADAERRAQLLAAAPAESSSPLAPPAFMTDPLLAAPLAKWREVVAVLADRGLYHPVLDRDMLAGYCVYAAEFAAAVIDIERHGYEVMVMNMAGDRMPRQRFAATRRDVAFKRMGEISALFGFTAADRFRLERADSQRRDLFTPTTPAPPAAEPGAAADGDGDAIGMLDAFDSPPPGARPN